MPPRVPERDKGISPILPRASSFSVCFSHSGLSVSFLSLVSVSQLCILPGGDSVGREVFLGTWILEGEVWGMLWSCFYHLETWQGETPGEMVEAVHACFKRCRQRFLLDLPWM